jgi:tRNA threonylcarbamoyladenosine dehydratase
MNSLNLQSHRTQLVLTALTATLATAGIFSLYSTYSRLERRRNLDRDVKRSIAEHDALEQQAVDKAHKTVPPTGMSLHDGPTSDSPSEELIREQLARNYAFFRVEGMQKIRSGNVVIVGCGGVGSWAAVMLVRS